MRFPKIIFKLSVKYCWSKAPFKSICVFYFFNLQMLLKFPKLRTRINQLEFRIDPSEIQRCRRTAMP